MSTKLCPPGCVVSVDANNRAVHSMSFNALGQQLRDDAVDAAVLTPLARDRGWAGDDTMTATAPKPLMLPSRDEVAL